MDGQFHLGRNAKCRLFFKTKAIAPVDYRLDIFRAESPILLLIPIVEKLNMGQSHLIQVKSQTLYP